MFPWFKKSVSGALGLELTSTGVAVAHLFDEEIDGLARAECEHFKGDLASCIAKLDKWISDRDLDQIGA